MAPATAAIVFGLLQLAAAATKPNLVFILADDWGYANLGVHNPGNPEVITPFINSLIADGLLLDRHYSFM